MNTRTFKLKNSNTPLFYTNIKLEGALNINYILVDSLGRKYILKQPKKSPPPSILAEEMTATGFLSDGRKYTFRSMKSQYLFTKKLLGKRINAPRAFWVSQNEILTEFIEGTPFDKYLSSGKTSAIQKVLSNTIATHNKDVVLGDRWSKNTIITNNEDSFQIDFDLKIIGPNIREFELAQVIAYILYFSSIPKITHKKIQDALNSLKDEIKFHYNTKIISEFLIRYCAFIELKTKKRIKEQVAQLTNFLKLD